MSRRSKRILMLRTHPTIHDPRVRIEAESLINRGYSVSLIEWDRSGRDPPKEKIYGIGVHRIRNSALMRAIPYDLFRLRFWWKLALEEAERIYRSKPFDIVHAHDFDTLPIGVELKKKYPIKLIYDAAEVWPYMLKGEVPEILIRKMVRMEKKFITEADAIITVVEGAKEYLLSIGATPEKIKIILNAKKLISDEYSPPENQRPKILYLGLLHRNRLVLELVEEAKKRKDIEVVVGGRGPLFEQIKEKAKGMENIDFKGFLPKMDDVIKWTMKSDVVYCVFNSEHPITKITFPNKFFEALVCGRPVMASKGTFLGEEVERLNCGIVVEATQKGIREGLDFIVQNPDKLEEMGKNALLAAKSGYNWEKQEEKLLKIYEEL